MYSRCGIGTSPPPVRQIGRVRLFTVKVAALSRYSGIMDLNMPNILRPLVWGPSSSLECLYPSSLAPLCNHAY
jgi:hypothetical protein